MVQSVAHHRDVVTSIALSADGLVLVTGSRDATVAVWRVAAAAAGDDGAGPFSSDSGGGGGWPVAGPTPLHVLVGHDDAVSGVAVSTDLGLVLSGSADGTCIVHTLRRGAYVRSVRPAWLRNRGRTTAAASGAKPSATATATATAGASSSPSAAASAASAAADAAVDFPIAWCGIAPRAGALVCYSAAARELHVFSANARPVAARHAGPAPLRAFAFSEDGRRLVAGGDAGEVLVFDLRTLDVVLRCDGSNGSNGTGNDGRGGQRGRGGRSGRGDAGRSVGSG